MVEALDDHERESARLFVEVPQQLTQAGALAVRGKVGVEEGRGRFESVFLAVGEKADVLLDQAGSWLVRNVSIRAVAIATVQMIDSLTEIPDGSHTWMLWRCVGAH